MSTTDDLAALAALLGLRVSREDLERWAPLLRALHRDLARLRELPLDDREPAFARARVGGPPAGEER